MVPVLIKHFCLALKPNYATYNSKYFWVKVITMVCSFCVKKKLNVLQKKQVTAKINTNLENELTKLNNFANHIWIFEGINWW